MPIDKEAVRLEEVQSIYRQDKATQERWRGDNLGNRAILRERTQAVGQMLKIHHYYPLKEKRILDIGCGCGSALAGLLNFGAQARNLYGVDLLPERIAEARRRYPDLNFQCLNAEKLDFPAGYFHLALLFTVFSSILDDTVAYNLAREAFRVLGPEGAILWYDFRYNNPYNLNVRGIKLSGIRRLFPGAKIYLRTITVLPPLARSLGRATDIFYPILSKVPLLRTHYLGVLIKGIDAEII